MCRYWFLEVWSRLDLCESTSYTCLMFLIAVTVHHCLNGLVPVYLSELCVPAAHRQSRTRYHLWSSFSNHSVCSEGQDVNPWHSLFFSVGQAWLFEKFPDVCFTLLTLIMLALLCVCSDAFIPYLKTSLFTHYRCDITNNRRYSTLETLCLCAI